MANPTPQETMAIAFTEVMTGKKNGFIVVGTLGEDKNLNTQASVMNMPLGDVAVAVAGVVARAQEKTKEQQKAK